MEQSISRRIFVAINIPRQFQKTVREFQKELSRERLPIIWSRPENLHITLVFLGEISGWELSKLGGIADDVSESVSPLPLTFGKIGIMKRRYHSQALYLEPKHSRKLLGLQRDLEKELVEEKIMETPRRGFKPHLTIGKFRQDTSLDKKIWRRWQKVPIDFSWQVESFAIMESNLDTKPVTYNQVREISLTEN